MDPREALRLNFGFERFRPGQAAAVSAALTDRDALVVMPTGSGKSLCYQLPALMRDDLTLVVSPLVSLMQDQVQALSRVAPGEVLLVNAQQGVAVNAEAIERAGRGDVRILYVAPERFAAPGFLAGISRARVGLFVVDEAHCVSQWGHDFRPDYFSLAGVARGLGARATIALTATATPRVADDIVRRLELRDPVRVTTGFDRPNLSLAVVPCATSADKRARIAAALSEPGALPAIVYAGTRGASEELAQALTSALGEEAVAYHAGLDRGLRALTQERFMSGEVRVIVATNAFGMGIDKANVRTVAHASVPGSLEAYYQEAGRAGRDGQPARCLLFAEQRDKGLHVFFIQRARAAARTAGESGAQALAASQVSARDAERVRWAQYRAVWDYVERTQCRRKALLAHFGDLTTPAPSVPCCDGCAGAPYPWASPGFRSRHAPAVPARARRRNADAVTPPAELDAAIFAVVGSARPAVGRTRTVEILRGGRSKMIAEHSYDGLPAYGAFAHLRSAEVLGRVDELLAAGTLRSSGGRFPKLLAA